MSSRMDKYKDNTELPTRSSKNKELYKQIYNAYDSFENLIVPSNAREISVSDLKKEIASREEYREKKETPVVKEKNVSKNNYEDDQVYDINELINKAVSEKERDKKEETTISNGDYLKKLKLDSRKTNIEQVKEMYEDIKEETLEEDESLLKTANLSLEILSDLKGDNDGTMVSAPIKSDEMPTESELDFYSSRYKFSKRDFDDEDDSYEEDNKKHIRKNKTKAQDEEEDEEYDDDDDEDDDEGGNGKFFFKVLLLIFGIVLIALVFVYFMHYFNKV